MRGTLGHVWFWAAMAGVVLAAPRGAVAGDEKALVGSYTLARRVTTDGKTFAGSELVGFMTFTKDHRTVIMKWSGPDGKPASIALIAMYSLSGGRYCESVAYGATADLGATGVTYDPPSPAPVCTAAVSDASGLAFDVPGESLRFRVLRDGILATTTRWTDHWEKVK